MSLPRIFATISYIAINCFLLSISLAHAQGFDDTGGIITTDVGSGDDHATSITVLSDGKILLGGYTYSDAVGRPDFAVVRYNANGNVDTSFGNNGAVITDFGLSFDLSFAMAVQSDSKIILAGNSTVTDSDVALARYHTDGAFDASFGAGNGMVTSDIAGFSDNGHSIAILTDGKILVSGASLGDFLLRKYASDGTVDSGFSGGLGYVTSHLQFGGFDSASAMAVQPDEKIVLVGSSDVGGNDDIALVRYNSDGTLDSSFNATGIVIYDINGHDDTLNDIALQPDEKIVVVGSYGDSATDFGLLVARYNSDGSLDTSFSLDGIALINIEGSQEGGAAVVIQPDGKILVGGDGGFNNSGGDGGEYFLVRFNSDGTLDNSFGNGDGMSVVDLGGGSDTLNDIALLSDGSILAAGSMSRNIVDVEFALVRFKPDGTLDAPDDSTGNVDDGTSGSGSSGGSVHIVLLFIFSLVLIILRIRR